MSIVKELDTGHEIDIYKYLAPARPSLQERPARRRPHRSSPRTTCPHHRLLPRNCSSVHLHHSLFVTACAGHAQMHAARGRPNPINPNEHAWNPNQMVSGHISRGLSLITPAQPARACYWRRRSRRCNLQPHMVQKDWLPHLHFASPGGVDGHAHMNGLLV